MGSRHHGSGDGGPRRALPYGGRLAVAVRRDGRRPGGAGAAVRGAGAEPAPRPRGPSAVARAAWATTRSARRDTRATRPSRWRCGPTDPALLHYRSGGFYCARAAQVPGHDPVRDVLLGLTASRDEPITGGRHKVFGNAALQRHPPDLDDRLAPAARGRSRVRAAPRAADRRPDPVARGRRRGRQPRRRLDQPLDGGRRPQRRRARRAHTAAPAPARRGRGQRLGHLGAQPPGLGRDGAVVPAGVHLPAGRRLGPARHPGHRPRGGRPGPHDPEAGDPAPADRAVPGPCGLRRRARLPPRARRDRRPRPRPAAGHRPGPARRRLVDRGRAGEVRRRALPRPGDRRRRPARRAPGLGGRDRAPRRPADPGRPRAPRPRTARRRSPGVCPRRAGRSPWPSPSTPR